MQQDARRSSGHRQDAPAVPEVRQPDYVEMDPEEAAEYGAFRDNVELEDVLEAGLPPDEDARGDGRG